MALALILSSFVAASRIGGAAQQYVLRPLTERQEIRDHFVVAALDMFLEGDDSRDAFDGSAFASQGVTVTLAER